MIPTGTKVYFAVDPVDLRRSFDGLAATAASVLDKDPRQGGLFIFLNKRKNQVRVLFKDTHGWCILAKRLDGARFVLPKFKDGSFCWQTDTAYLMRFLDSVVLSPRSKAATKNHLSVVK